MANITQEQVNRINNKCKNDWHLDIQYYLNWSEKILIKRINLDADSYLEYTLSYNLHNQIYIRIQKYYIENGCGVSSGLGKTLIIDETIYARKNINKLIEYTDKLNNTELMIIKDTAKIVDVTGMVSSENF